MSRRELIRSFSEDPYIGSDVMDMLCGDLLGEGLTRAVFVNRLDPDYVLKVEKPHRDFVMFQNVVEWTVWQYVKDDPKLSKWFAPCRMISPAGTVLLQRRGESIDPSYLPSKIPAFLQDTKRSNFGRVDGNVVAVDYGILPPPQTWSKRMVKAEWWDIGEESLHDLIY